MGIRLSIDVVSPLEPEDREPFTDPSIMTLAIADPEMGKVHFPGTFPDPDDPELALGDTELAEAVQRDDEAVEAEPPTAMATFSMTTSRLHPESLPTRSEPPSQSADKSSGPIVWRHLSDEEADALLAEAERRGKDEPGSITVLVPPKKS